jgi:hypothetical protein
MHICFLSESKLNGLASGYLTPKEKMLELRQVLPSDTSMV